MLRLTSPTKLIFALALVFGSLTTTQIQAQSLTENRSVEVASSRVADSDTSKTGTANTATTSSAIGTISIATDEQNNIDVYRAISPGVVFITSSKGNRDLTQASPRKGTGSGSIIDSQGHILTNNHVIEGAQQLSVSVNGKAYPARVIGADPDTDLAIIKINVPADQKLTVVPLGDSDRLTIGQKVLAIGNPFGLDRTLTTGVISGLERPIHARNGRLIQGAIQTDASINPGNSGGPMLDSRGNMIGINSQILAPAGGSVGVGFAVPVNIARRIIPQLISTGYVNRARLGVGTRSVKELKESLPLPVEEGLIIVQVAPNSSAASAGLRSLKQAENGDIQLGDIIVGVDGKKISTTDDLTGILDKRQIGDVIKLEIVRNRERTTVDVKLLPQERSNTNNTGNGVRKG